MADFSSQNLKPWTPLNAGYDSIGTKDFHISNAPNYPILFEFSRVEVFCLKSIYTLICRCNKFAFPWRCSTRIGAVLIPTANIIPWTELYFNLSHILLFHIYKLNDSISQYHKILCDNTASMWHGKPLFLLTT